MQRGLLRSLPVLAALVVAGGAQAQPGRASEADVSSTSRDPDESISIRQLVEIAVRRSQDLALIRTNEKRAELGETIAAGVSEARVSASVSGEKRTETTKLVGRVGIAKLLPTGGDLAVALQTSQEQVVATTQSQGAQAATSQVVPVAITALSVDLRQPLLRGVGSNAHVEQKKAAIAGDAASLQARDATGAMLRDLVEAYWELSFARASLGVRTQSLALAQSQLELSQKMAARGALPESGVVAAKYGVALRKEALLRARDAVQSASLRLRRLAGLEIGIELGDLAPTDALVVPKQIASVDGAIASALAQSPRIAAARMGIAIADIELDARKNGTLPSLDLGASASMAGDTENFVGSGGTKDYQVVGSLTLRWEIGGAAKAAAEAARLDRTSAKLTAKDIERDTIALVIDVARRVRAAQQRSEVAALAIELAKSNLDTELSLFRHDKSSNVLVFERQTELDEARLLASRAAADCQIAIATLEYLTGSLLERHGVESRKSKSKKES